MPSTFRFLLGILLFFFFWAETLHAFSVTSPTTRRTYWTTTRLFAVTPNQIKFLRKEAAQRLARKSLSQVFLPDQEDGMMMTSSSSSSFPAIWEALQQHELVQIRGISRDNIRHVYVTAQQMVLELNYFMSTKTRTQVELIETSGHSALLYAPADPPRIILRSSYKEGQWTKKPKKPRDHRGQIIQVEDL
ncbi:hypothetical protein FisN_15Lh259 [Fistulifera solaris]|uniref:Uncharacterized protein n=1 Tax=Fistulifera solaris TaxID=1519565 RepID=A0A1Z5JBZ9_FISSO|nr:hypothetical protein FisN_15Lh259 [Fistulifera solaris]|eukprot:GAX11328.1 hypothetical protein FisN_15Lh259 [Fistulifera solaris]